MTLFLSDEFRDALPASDAEFKRALRHLVEWAMWSERYRHVSIHGVPSGRDAGCLHATYTDDHKQATYFLAAVWDPATQTYTFHS